MVSQDTNAVKKSAPLATWAIDAHCVSSQVSGSQELPWEHLGFYQPS